MFAKVISICVLKMWLVVFLFIWISKKNWIGGLAVVTGTLSTTSWFTYLPYYILTYLFT